MYRKRMMNIPGFIPTFYKRKVVFLNKNGMRIMAESRCIWFHKNFGGPDGWKKYRYEFLRRNGIESIKILGRIFGHIVMLDSSHEQFWKLPKVYTTKKNIAAGWLWWAIYVSKQTSYPVDNILGTPAKNEDLNDHVFVIRSST